MSTWPDRSHSPRLPSIDTRPGAGTAWRPWFSVCVARAGAARPNARQSAASALPAVRQGIGFIMILAPSRRGASRQERQPEEPDGTHDNGGEAISVLSHYWVFFTTVVSLQRAR